MKASIFMMVVENAHQNNIQYVCKHNLNMHTGTQWHKKVTHESCMQIYVHYLSLPIFHMPAHYLRKLPWSNRSD